MGGDGPLGVCGVCILVLIHRSACEGCKPHIDIGLVQVKAVEGTVAASTRTEPPPLRGYRV